MNEEPIFGSLYASKQQAQVRPRTRVAVQQMNTGCDRCDLWGGTAHGLKPCPLESIPQQVNLAHSEFFEMRAIHVPGRPTFRTRGQRDRYLKRHGQVQFSKSDVPWMKRKLASANGRLAPKHDMKAWWRKEAHKYGELVNKPAFRAT